MSEQYIKIDYKITYACNAHITRSEYYKCHLLHFFKCYKCHLLQLN